MLKRRRKSAELSLEKLNNRVLVGLVCNFCGVVLDGRERPWIVDHASHKCKCGNKMERIWEEKDGK